MTLKHAREVRGILNDRWLNAFFQRDAAKASEINAELLKWEDQVRALEAQADKP